MTENLFRLAEVLVVAATITYSATRVARRTCTEFGMRLARGALSALLLALPAHAEWKQQDLNNEYESCLPSCDKNNPRDHDHCIRYCHCITDGLQAEFSGHDQLVRDTTQLKLPDRIARLQRLANHCNHEIWKTPARKLKFQ